MVRRGKVYIYISINWERSRKSKMPYEAFPAPRASLNGWLSKIITTNKV